MTITLDALNDILDTYPQLTDYGLGIYWRPNTTAQDRKAELDQGREALRKALPDIVAAHDWLVANIAKTTTPPHNGLSSYAVKHIAERALGQYISNGQLIAAALLAGYPMRQHYDSPNPTFAMSQRALKSADPGDKDVSRGENIAAGRDAVACPACGTESFYHLGMDRYVHRNGTRNDLCWVHISSGRQDFFAPNQFDVESHTR